MPSVKVWDAALAPLETIIAPVAANPFPRATINFSPFAVPAYWVITARVAHFSASSPATCAISAWSATGQALRPFLQSVMLPWDTPSVLASL